jgi:hypothetical protein
MKNTLSFSVKRFALSILLSVCTSISFGQLYFGGGVNLIKSFTVKSPYLGLTLMGEKIDDNQSLYANFSMSLNKNEQDQLFPMSSSSNLSDTAILGNLTYRYNTLELGRRNYFTDDLEFGVGFYLAEHVTISYNTVGINLSNYNTSKYHLPSTIPSKGNILAFAIGGNAGAQYAFFRGVIYSDIGFNYTLVGLPNNITAQNTTSFSQINFTFTLGFKKTLNFHY